MTEIPILASNMSAPNLHGFRLSTVSPLNTMLRVSIIRCSFSLCVCCSARRLVNVETLLTVRCLRRHTLWEIACLVFSWVARRAARGAIASSSPALSYRECYNFCMSKSTTICFDYQNRINPCRSPCRVECASSVCARQKSVMRRWNEAWTHIHIVFCRADVQHFWSRASSVWSE